MDWSLVNIFIGSGGPAYGYGSVNPAAQLPYGALRLGPDTRFSKEDVDVTFRHFSGYNFNDTYLRMFSHTHLGKTLSHNSLFLHFIPPLY